MLLDPFYGFRWNQVYHLNRDDKIEALSGKLYEYSIEPLFRDVSITYGVSTELLMKLIKN